MSYRYNSTRAVRGTTPTMPNFILVRKITNTTFTFPDSVEMPTILSPSRPNMDATMDGASQRRMQTTTDVFAPAQLNGHVDGGSTIVGFPV